MINGKVKGFIIFYSEYSEVLNKRNVLTCSNQATFSSKKEAVKSLISTVDGWLDDCEVYEQEFTTYEQIYAYLDKLRKECLSYRAFYSFEDGEFIDALDETEAYIEGLAKSVFKEITAQQEARAKAKKASEDREKEINDIISEIKRLTARKEELVRSYV